MENSSARDSLKAERSLLWRHFGLGAAILVIVSLLAAFEVHRLLGDPEVFFLRGDEHAQWIRAETQFALGTYVPADIGVTFECSFETLGVTSDARLTVRAFRRCVVRLDERTIYASPLDLSTWQSVRDVPIREPLAPGTHRLQIAVYNRNAFPCLLAYSRELGIRTSAERWYAISPDGQRRRAVLATQVVEPNEALTYPSVSQAFGRVWYWLLGLFAIAFAWFKWSDQTPLRTENLRRWYVRPWHVRLALLAAWTVLAANNIWQLPVELGYDSSEHVDYVEYIARHRSLPLATDGWQMFQPPLFYLLEAPWFALLSPLYSKDVVLRVLGIVPMLCGLAQVEIVYRTARAVFPNKEDLQLIAIVVGGLMPMNMYISQSIGNEPLAGSLTALVVFLCLSMLIEPTALRRSWYFLAMGSVWGLAIISKVTPLLLTPLIIAAVVMHCRQTRATRRQGFVRVALVFGAAFVVSGWYFARNLVAMGKPFADRFGHIAWWQNPSYRTLEQLTSFGAAVTRPIYSGAWSMWDGLYSSMWLDGFLSGAISPPAPCPWNLSWLIVGAWLGLVPTAFILASPATSWRKEFNAARTALWFALAAIAVYLAAFIDLYLRLPVYSTAKATYLIGLLPCYAILAAVGAAPLLRFRLLRALVLAAIICWGVASYLTYFETSALRRLLD
jgi:hypothetical protein